MQIFFSRQQKMTKKGHVFQNRHKWTRKLCEISQTPRFCEKQKPRETAPSEGTALENRRRNDYLFSVIKSDIHSIAII